jgi:hypothetical protein
MSPSPTRLNRRNADDGAGDVCRRHPSAGVYVCRPRGDIERTQPGHAIGINLQDARTRTATGSLPQRVNVQHMNEGRHDGMPRELTPMPIMLAEPP